MSGAGLAGQSGIAGASGGLGRATDAKLDVRVRPLVQPGPPRAAVYIVARAHRRAALAHAAHDHQHGARAGARARHARAADRDADRQDAADARQDPAIRARGLRADDRDPAAGQAWCSTCRFAATCPAVRHHAGVHRRESRLGLLISTWCGPRSRRCSSASSSCCPTSCSPASCFRARRCRRRLSGSATAIPLTYYLARAARHAAQGSGSRCTLARRSHAMLFAVLLWP